MRRLRNEIGNPVEPHYVVRRLRFGDDYFRARYRAGVRPVAAQGGSHARRYRTRLRRLPQGTSSCLTTAPGAFLKPTDTAYGGAMFKKSGTTYFVYSSTFVFRTEDQAKRFATFRASTGYKQCQAKEDDAATRKSAPDIYVKLTPIPWSDSTGHIPTMYRELTGSRSTSINNGFYDRYTVRRGRVVIVVYVDSSLGHTDAQSNAIAKQTGGVLQSFDAALDTRLAGA
jgi:hypothetical protein